MSRVFSFSFSGQISLDLNKVVFSDFEGEIADVSKLSKGEILDKLRDGELDYDWIQVIGNKDGDGSLDLEDVDIKNN